MAGLRGTLRDALALADDRALLLTDHALTEIDLATHTITRHLTSKIGRYNSYLRREDREDGDVVAVGSANAAMETLVSLDALTVARRRRRGPLVSALLSTGATRAGAARVLASREAFAIVATETRESAPQRLLVLTSDGYSETVSVDFPSGLHSAHWVADGALAAGTDIGQARTLTVIPAVISSIAASNGMTLDDLVSAANESAVKILDARARRNPPRTVYRDLRLEPGEEIADVTARRVTLENCVAGRAADRHERPRITRVHLTDLELQNSSLNGAVFEDVTVDGLRCPGSSGFFFGCELHRVTLTGRVHGLILNPALDALDHATSARYAQWHRERMDDPGWMLDLTEATGNITIRGYPSRFIRRNPNLQAVVTAEALRTHDWRAVDAGRSSLRVSLQELARSDWEDATLIADPHGPRADDDLRYIERLRHEGIALPD